MRVSENQSFIKKAAPIVGSVMGVAAFGYFGYLTIDAIARQRSFRASLLPATGVLVSGLFIAYTSSPPTSTRSGDGLITTLSNFTFYKVDGRFFARKQGEEKETPAHEALFDLFMANRDKESDRGRRTNSFYYAPYLSQDDAQLLATLALTPDEDGNYPIVQWRPEESSPLLKYKFEIPALVQQQLFVRYAESGSFSYCGISHFVKRCPDGILAMRQLRNSLLVKETDPFEAQAVRSLIEAMREKEVEFTPEEAWIVRAADDSIDFEAGEFTSLSEEEKKKIYCIANGLHARNLIARLKELGMGGTFEHRLTLQPMLAYEMDLIAAQEAMSGYLRSLRQTGRLVTRSEFAQMNPGRYMDKQSRSFERIAGADFIQKVATQYNCPAVMVPRKIAVIDGDPSELTIDLLSMRCPSITVYAERVTPVDQKCSVDEVVQLMRVIKHTGFADFGIGRSTNIFRTQGGFHFIDTEFSSFSDRATSLRTLQSCAKMVEENDQPAIMKAAQEIFDEEQFRSQERAAARTYFEEHPHWFLLDVIGSVTVPMAEIFQSS